MTASPARRVQLTFWFLVLVAVLATGLVSRAVTWSGASAVLTTAVGGILALGAVLLALRIVVITARRPSAGRDGV